MRIDHMATMAHLPAEWIGFKEPVTVDMSACEKFVGRILEGGNFAERVKEFADIIKGLGVRVT